MPTSHDDNEEKKILNTSSKRLRKAEVYHSVKVKLDSIFPVYLLEEPLQEIIPHVPQDHFPKESQDYLLQHHNPPYQSQEEPQSEVSQLCNSYIFNSVSYV